MMNRIGSHTFIKADGVHNANVYKECSFAALRMSLTEVRIKNTEIRIPLGRLIHQLLLTSQPSSWSKRASIESQGDTPIHNMIHILIETQNKNKWLGRGSAGTVYHAKFVLPKHQIDCVVKFPNTLLDNDCIQINDKTGTIAVNPKKKQEAKEYRRQALDEFEIEWHNAFLLHCGKEMMHTKVAEPYHSSIQVARIDSAARSMQKLKHEWGYQHIHELLAMDASIPCLISQHFEMALLKWAKATKPSRDVVETKVVPQILAGLRYMHECAELAHMDVKPNNMLYSPGKHIVISDFGASMPAMLPHHEPAGTIGYMAPEVAKTNGSFIPKYADAYSFAVAVMHLIHPEVPCDKRDEQMMMLQRLQEQESQQESKWSYMLQLPPQERYEVLQDMINVEHEKHANGLWVQKAPSI